MKLVVKRTTCRVLVASLLTLSFHTAQAGLIGADQVAPARSPGSDRALVLGTLDRAEVAAQLQAAGVDPRAARERVATMTDQEVQVLAQDIENAPAGALSGWGWAAVIVVGSLIWYYAIRK